MAKTAKAAPAYTPGKSYKVTLARPVQWRPGVWLRPGEDHTLDGTVCTEIADVILTAVEV